MKKTKTVKAWAVVWVEGALDLYGVPRPTPAELLVGCTVERFLADGIGVYKKNTELYADYALFKSNKDAETYRKKNKEWQVISCTITYTL